MDEGRVAAIAEKLPHARATMDLSGLKNIDTESIKTSLEELETDFGDPEGDAWDKLEGKVDEGVEEADPEYAPPPNPDRLPPPPTDIFGNEITPEEWHPPSSPTRRARTRRTGASSARSPARCRSPSTSGPGTARSRRT